MKQKIISIFVLILLCLPTTAILQQKKITPQKKLNNQRYRLARQYEVAGKYQQALQLYQRLWDADPRNITYYRGVKNSLLHLKRYSEAIQAAEKMLTIRRSIYVEADLGEIYFKLGEQEKAFQIWHDVINHNKTKVSAYQAVANSMISNRLLDEAIKLYKQGRKNLANQSMFLVELANLYHAQLDYKNASLMYLKYLNHHPKRFSYVEGQLSKLAKDIEEIEPVIGIISDEIKRHQNPTLLRKLLADLYVRSSNYEQALEEYKFLDEHDSSNKKEVWGRELYKFARTALNDGAYHYSEQAFQILISRYPDSPYVPRAQFGLADALYRQGNYTQAVTAYQQIADRYPRHVEAKKAYLKMGEIRLNQFNDPDAAKASFNSLLNNFPFSREHFQAMFKNAECEIRLGNLAQAKNWFQKAMTTKKASDDIKDEAHYNLALLDFWGGKFDAALKKLEHITQSQPILRKGKSNFYVNDALELSMLIQENRNQSKLLKDYATSLLLIERQLYDDALAKLKNLFENNPQANLADDILIMIGEVESKLLQFQAAITTYRSLIHHYPESVLCDFAQKRIGDIYRNDLTDVGKAIQEYELVLANYPESLLVEQVRKNIRELESSGLR